MGDGVFPGIGGSPVARSNTIMDDLGCLNLVGFSALKTLFLILIAAVLSACGTTSSVRVMVPVMERVAFNFSDARPPEERRSRIEESKFWTTSYYADETLSPAAPELFKHFLAAKLNDALSGRSVKLIEFSVMASDPRVFINNNIDLAAGFTPKPNPLGVMLAAPFILGIESIKSQKRVAVKIRAAVNEQEFSSQCSGAFRGRATEENIRSIVLDCLQKISGDIGAIYIR
jgi:hypothetical protein